ncbi:MAG: signal peptidase I [Myxococcales bacterium]|nr:signal peptidase I [Myxococcales bacterium]
MARLRRRQIRGPRTFPGIRRKEIVGLVLFLTIVSLLAFQLFIGQVMRVASDTMSPTIQAEDVILVSYSDGDPGDVVVVDDGQYQVLRRLIGVPGDNIELTNKGPLRNETRLVPVGLQAEWVTTTELGDRAKGLPNRSRLNLRQNRIVQVPPDFVYVGCDLARFCRRSPIKGLVPKDHLMGRVINQWPDRAAFISKTP